MKRHILTYATLITAQMLLAGCDMAVFDSETHRPAPVTQLGLRAGNAAGIATVQPGDTLYALAQRYRLPLRGIIDLNGISPPYTITAGQRLMLPPPTDYTARAGDNVTQVASMFAVPVSDIVRTNNLKPPFALKTGQVLRIPVEGGTQGGQQNMMAAAHVPPLAPAHGGAVKTPPVYAQNSYGAPPRQNPYAAAQAMPPQPASASAPAAITRASTSPVIAAAQGQGGGLPMAPPVPRASPVPQIVLGSARPDFIWPVQGKVISGYGPKQGGLYNDGINIAAPRGTPVASAGDGIVAYVGSDLGNYGNLVLIRHSGGMVTAYAHLSSIAVKKGQSVIRGQAIGAVGTTGTVANAQLHFEVRQGSQTYDPKKWLG